MSPPAPTPALARALVEACTGAVRPTECAVVTPDSEMRPTASVTWATDATVDVEVRSQRQDGTPPSVRRIVFRREDSDADRWKSVGLVVASLVTNGEIPREPEVFAARSPRPSKWFRNAVWIGVGALAGNGLHPGPPRYGGWIRAAYQIARLPMFLSLGSAYAGSSNSAGVKPEWATFSSGAGALLSVRTLELAVRPGLGLAIEHVAARALTGSGSTSGGRWIPATQGSVMLTWPDRGPIAVTLGGLAGFATGATGVRSGGQEVTAFPALSYAVLLGIELGFWN